MTLPRPTWFRSTLFTGLLMGLLSSVTSECLFAAAPPAPPATGTTNSTAAIYFETDIVPLLTRYGCNGGGCHGKSTGQNGFRLSLLGFEPAVDHETIVREGRGRRIALAAPRESLLLKKATASIPHGGGQRIRLDSDDYRVLVRWIERGAPPAAPSDPRLERVTVAPTRADLDEQQQHVALRVTAHFSNGTTRDVTRQAVYQSNEPEIADVDETGAVQRRQQRGRFAVMARFGEQFCVFDGAVRGPAVEFEERSVPGLADENPVTRALVAQWRRLGLTPSPRAPDGEFIRRASLDMCGTLPTVDETRAFINDARPDKRERLIDRLLEKPEYASFFALRWADILRNRGKGYATSQQRPGTALFAGWLRDCVAENRPYDQLATAILTASGNQETNPPTVWYRNVRTTPDYVESVAQAFLGMRIQCAQCHHHPAERWSQDDYYGFAAFFARVGRKGGFADAEVPTSETIFLAPTGQVVQPRSGRVMAPKPLGAAPPSLAPYDDPRRALARWLTAPDNPYFARTMVNRLWGHFLGRGIIHPIDDARESNPPSNPELLDALTADFVAHRYDVKHLIRTICLSPAYGLSAVPTETNRDDYQSFARFYPKRLAAEVLLDAFSQVLDVPTRFPNVAGEFPLGTRAIDLPDEAVPSNFLDVFGRPARTTACECERVSAPALGQTLELVSSPEIHRKLTAAEGWVARLVKDGRTHEERVYELFLRTLSREPRSNELQTAVAFLNSRADAGDAYRSLLWALLATNEFLFNH